MCIQVTCQGGEWIDARMLIAGMAILLGIFNLWWTSHLDRSARKRGEILIHFDQDIREVAHQAFDDLRKHRQEILQVVTDGGQNVADDLDRVRDKKIGPTIYEIRQAALETIGEYGDYIDRKRLTGHNQAIDDEHDRLMEAISDLRRATIEGTGTNTAEFNEAIYDFIKAVRQLLNDIRAVISTRKGLQDLKRG